MIWWEEIVDAFKEKGSAHAADMVKKNCKSLAINLMSDIRRGPIHQKQIDYLKEELKVLNQEYSALLTQYSSKKRIAERIAKSNAYQSKKENRHDIFSAHHYESGLRSKSYNDHNTMQLSKDTKPRTGRNKSFGQGSNIFSKYR
jgi:hypothetical protein